MASKHMYVAIDPLALILPTEIYVKIHSPDPAPDFKVSIAEASKKMTAADKKTALANAKFLKEIAEASIHALSV